VILALLMTVTPAAGRTAPELSDVALFAVAVLAVWFVRRRLRDRFRRRDRD
jgi:membrane protein implicated in regulation of membrane protease activity